METRWLWPFELIEKIGEGAMGTVYRARYLGNDRMVAVKLLPAELADDPILAARFERELDVLKQLHHPNIVHCFGGTCESKQRFYAMELVDGGTLADLLAKKGRLPWAFVVDYALQMCDALQYAHERGVIHRDVKPGNFLLTKSGQIKLSDFGVALITTPQRLTAAGWTVGTIHYMAPEQIRGKSGLTGRADLYALGCVLYEMLTGRAPFSGENAAAIIQQHLSGPVPHAAAVVLDCPLKLDELTCKLMHKDPEQRPASAAEVRWRLEEILQPGLRAAPGAFDLFSDSLPSKATIPIQSLARTPSDAAIPTPARFSVRSLVPWGMAILLLPVCFALWIGWNNTVVRLHHAERQWVDLFERSDPGVRIMAAKALAEFGPLQSSSIEALRTGTKDANPTVRVAALSALGRHASECRWMQNEMQRIEKVDEHPDVRHQAGVALMAMKQAPAGFSVSRLVFWGVVVLLCSSLLVGGWTVWQRLKPLAAS